MLLSANDWKITDAASSPACGRDGKVFSIWISKGVASGPDTGRPCPGSGPPWGAGSGGPTGSGVVSAGPGTWLAFGEGEGGGHGLAAWLEVQPGSKSRKGRGTSTAGGRDPPP